MSQQVTLQVIIVNISGVGFHILTNLFREYLAILNS